MKITRKQLRQIIKEESEKFDPDTQGSMAVALKSAGLEHLNPSTALDASEENRLKAFVKENPDLVRKSIMAGTFGTVAALAVGSQALKGEVDFGAYASSHGIDDWQDVRDRRGSKEWRTGGPWKRGDPGNIPVPNKGVTVQDVVGKKKWAGMSDRQREAALHNLIGGRSKAQAWAYANPELTIAGAAIAGGLLGLGVDYIIQKALGKKKNESLTRKQLRQMIKEEISLLEADTDGDGALDADELRDLASSIDTGAPRLQPFIDYISVGDLKSTEEVVAWMESQGYDDQTIDAILDHPEVGKYYEPRDDAWGISEVPYAGPGDGSLMRGLTKFAHTPREKKGIGATSYEKTALDYKRHPEWFN
tara:strand:- start:5562 stop:6647 length:1086 start_codon:yes stop_codon:yes gene_type:complete